KASVSYEQSLEIKTLKHTLPEHLKEKESLKQKITLLKNDFQKKEYRNIDRELALEKQETLLLAEESRSKMIEKQNDPKMAEKKVITKPIDFAVLNQLLKDFETRFVPQTELSAEQAFWSHYSVQPEEPNLSASTTIVEVPKELSKVSLGTWGFEHTKACFRDDIIPNLKALKELFNSFDQFLIDELSEVQQVFKQMEQVVEQHCVEKNKFQDKMKNVLKENDRLLTQALSVDIVNIIVHDNVKSACMNVDVCERCVTIESELKKDFIKKDCYDTLFQNAPTFAELFEINDLKAQAQAKDTVILKLREKLHSLAGDVNERKVKRELEEKVLVITALKETLSKLKGKAVVTEAVSLHLLDPELLKIDVTPLAPKLLKNRTTHTDYIRHTQEEAATLREIVESERLLNPLNTSLDYALGNVCPLTRIATTTIVPPREPIPIASNTDKPVITLVYSRKSKATKKVPVSNSTINKSLVANKMEPNNSWGSSSSNVHSSLIECMLSKVFSACAMGKSTKKNHKPKSKDTNQENLYLLHRDLCGPTRVESVNRKKYILIIMDDYSRFTWSDVSEQTMGLSLLIKRCGIIMKMLASLMGLIEAARTMLIYTQALLFLWAEAVATACFTQNRSVIRLRHGKTSYELMHVRLKVPVHRIRTDNGTEFVNQTLRDYYEEVGISHETSVARSSQQNGVVERRNRTLIEVARTMLIYAQASLFLWAEAVATACFTQN
nr:putative ribonuclease H-like domain-containing protein [Tanacetum cinerariifolium]